MKSTLVKKTSKNNCVDKFTETYFKEKPIPIREKKTGKVNSIKKAEKAEKIFHYIERQLCEMSFLIRTLASQEYLKNEFKMQKAEQCKACLKKREEILKEIKKCQQNIDKAITSLKDFARLNIPLNPDSELFEYINEWTDFVIKSHNRYERYKNKTQLPLPSFISEYNFYKQSIEKLNKIIDTINRRECQQDYQIPFCNELT